MRQIFVCDLHRIVVVLTGYYNGVMTLGRMKRCWALTPAEDATRWPANNLSEWLRVPFTADGHAPPEGISWNSHNLRKGAAFATNTIQVRLTDIRFAVGWATNSTVLEAKHIDFAMRPTPEACIFFGYLRKDTLELQGS
jgi:hypothetical protein